METARSSEAAAPASGAAGPAAGGRRARGHALQLLGPCSGTVAMLASWLIAVPRIRSLAEELGVELPALTRVLVDHAGTITTVAAVVAALGITALELSRKRRVRIGISVVTSLILFGLVIWDVVVFWLLYVETLKDVG